MQYRDGYLTVFLSLALSVMISLSLLLVLGARENSRRMAIECITDIGMNNILAEYHRELLNQYDLFFIDTSYGSAEADYEFTAGRLLWYIRKNLGKEGLFPEAVYREPLKLQVEEVIFTRVSAAADMGGAILRRQAVDVMRQNYGEVYLRQLESWLSDIREYDLHTTDVLAQQRQACAALEEWNGKVIFVDGREQILQVENPAASVCRFWEAGILNYTVEDIKTLSTLRIPEGSRLSERELLTGTGMGAGVEFEDNWWQQLIFHEYIMSRTGHYGAEKEGGFLKYQTEYLVAGQNNDLDNLKSVVNAIFSIRAAANLLYLLADTEKMEMTQMLAYGLATLLMLPELEPLFQAVLVFTWALVESVYDVSALLKGERVPLLKASGDWHYSLEEMLNLEDITGEEEKTGGLAYEDYLRLFLMLQEKEVTTCRLMDVMEMDIRMTEGNRYFRLDGCIDSLTAEIRYEGADGREYWITRSYGY